MKSTVFLSILLLSIFSAYAQEQNLPSNLDNQYSDLKEKAETYNEFKVIRETRLDEWYNVIQDSIRNLKSQIVDEKKYSEGLNDTISSINSRMEQLTNSVQEFEHGQTHITVLGIDFTKKGFVILTFIVEAILVIILIILSFKFYDSHRVTSETLREHEHQTQEFEEYKRRALEKQTKLARDLQTAQNRLDELRKKR